MINDATLSSLDNRSYLRAKESLVDLVPHQRSLVSSVPSLDTACEPLLSLVPSLLRSLALVREKCREPANGLTPDQSASIMLFTMHVDLLNAALRSQQRDQLRPWMLYLQLFLQSLSCLPTISATVYRTGPVEITPFDRLITWPTFDFARPAADDRPLVTIECQTGKDIGHHCYQNTHETVLLIAGTQYEVLSSSDEHLHLREIPSHHLLMFIHESDGHSSMPLSGHFLSSISSINIQSRSKVESIEKYIDRTLRLQQKIDAHPLFVSIDLVDQSLDDEDIALVVQHAIVKKQCSILRLDENFLTWKSTKVLAEVLQNNRTLIGLNLSSNRLFDQGLIELLSRSESNCLEKLHLGSNRISDEGAFQLARMLRTNTRLTVLWLDHNRIGDEGLHHLLDVLSHHNRTLQELSLKGNQLITGASFQEISQFLSINRSLKELDLTQCGLTQEEYRCLHELAKEQPHRIARLDVEPAECLIA